MSNEDQSKKHNTSLRAQSRVNWGRKQIDGIPTDEQLSTGALMRIADRLDNGTYVPMYTVESLISTGRELLRLRKRQPRKDQFHFTFEQPANEPRFLSVTSKATGVTANICIAKISAITERSSGGTVIFIDGIDDGFVCKEKIDVVMQKIQKP